MDALEGQLTAYDFYLGMEVPVSRKEAEKILEGGNSWRVVETPSMQEIIRSRGYDAIHALDEGVQYMAVFAPNQLKASGKYLYSERNTGVFHRATTTYVSGKSIMASPLPLPVTGV